jgi:hypothetical protein
VAARVGCRVAIPADVDYFDLRAWQVAEAGITNELWPILAHARIAPLWRATNYSVHILYSSCAQHADAAPCSHTEDKHTLMWLGGRVLTNSLAAVRLLLAGYYGPSVALVRDSVESTLLLGLFEAVPEDVAVWRSMTDSRARWKLFSPAKVRDKLVERKVWHRYQDYDLYSALAGHPTPRSSRLFFSERWERRMVGPFVDTENAEKTLHAIALSTAHGAYQIADLLNVRDRFTAELKRLDEALHAWSHHEE